MTRILRVIRHSDYHKDPASRLPGNSPTIHAITKDNLANAGSTLCGDELHHIPETYVDFWELVHEGGVTCRKCRQQPINVKSTSSILPAGTLTLNLHFDSNSPAELLAWEKALTNVKMRGIPNTIGLLRAIMNGIEADLSVAEAAKNYTSATSISVWDVDINWGDES